MTGVRMHQENDEAARERIRTATARALKKCKPAVRQVARRQIAETVSSLLDLDLSEFIADGWRGYDELTEAAERTLGQPDVTENVTVSEHRFRTDRSTILEVRVDGERLSDLVVDLAVEFCVRALDATLREGCVVRLSSGRCDVTAVVTVSGVPLPEAKATLDLTVAMSVSPPIRIRPRPETPRPAGEPPEVVVLPDARAHADGQRRASPAGSPPSSDLA
jgi:hypothetical protein